MSRITKTIAEQVAIKLTENKSKQLNDLNERLKSLATSIKIGSLPADVVKVFKKHPKYFNIHSSEYFTGPGLARNLSVNLDGPWPRNGNWIQCTDKEAEAMVALQDSINDLRGTINKVRQDVEVALIALRTYNNVEKEFPEAFPHLPTRTSMSLAINISDVRRAIA